MGRNLAAVQSKNATATELKRQAVELATKTADLEAKEAELRRLNADLQALRETASETSQKLRKVSAERDHLLQKQKIAELATSNIPRDEVIARLTHTTETLSNDLAERDDRLIELLDMCDNTASERDALVETVQSLSDKLGADDQLIQSLKSQVLEATEQNLQLSENLGEALLTSQAAHVKAASYEEQIRMLTLRTSMSPAVAEDQLVTTTTTTSSSSSSSAEQRQLQHQTLTNSTEEGGHLTQAIESLGELTNFQSLLDQFLQNWQLPVGAIEISVQALTITRMVSLLQAVCCAVSIDQLYALLDKYCAAILKHRPIKTLFGLDPYSVLSLVVSVIKDKIHELQSTYIKGLDRDGMLGLRALWQAKNNVYATNTFLPMLEHRFLVVLSNDLQKVSDCARIDSGRRRFFDFLADEGANTTAQPIIGVITAMIEWRAHELSPATTTTSGSSSSSSSSSLVPASTSIPIPDKQAAPAAASPQTSSNASSPPPIPPSAPELPPARPKFGGGGGLLEDISSFRFPRRAALRASMGEQNTIHRNAQVQQPAKMRVLAVQTITQLVEREAMVRALHEPEKEEDDEDDWSDQDDDDDDASHSASDAAVWRKLIAERTHTYGAFDPEQLDVREAFLPLQVSNQLTDEVNGFVLLKPVHNDPTAVEIYFFGILSDQLRNNSFVNSMAECARLVQMTLSSANKIPPGSREFDMTVRIQVLPDSKLFAFFTGLGFVQAGQNEKDKLVILEKTQLQALEQISGTMQLQYTFILKRR